MTDLKTLREVAERAQADSTEEAMNEFCAVFNLPACLALLDRIEELEARLDKLAVAARTHLATHPVFRQRVGDEGSRARLLQADQIATENALFAALKDTPNG